MSVHESGVSRVTIILHFAGGISPVELVNDEAHGGVHPLDTKIPLCGFLGNFFDAFKKRHGVDEVTVTQINIIIERYAGGRIETAYLHPEKIALLINDPIPIGEFLREILDATPPTPALPPPPNRKLN